MSEKKEEIPGHINIGKYLHKEEDDPALFENSHIDNFLSQKAVNWPLHLELKKDKCWYRLEITGKYYSITKDLEFIFGNSYISQDKYEGEDKDELEVREQYVLLFGNISRNHTIASLEFHANQMQKNAYKIITLEEFEEKLKMISEDFSNFTNKEYKNLKINSKDG